ncbi:MAG TPA: NlpC/P60 family protein [Methylomirabilota bacterium]
MTAADDHAPPLPEAKDTPPDGRRAVVVGLAIGLVLCLLLAVGVALLARKQIGELTRERDAARGELQKATAENAARMERFILAARLELAELAHLLVVARQDPNTGRDISDPVLPASLAGKRRAALAAAFELKQAKVPFRWGGRRKEDGVDSVGFAALALAEAGMLLRPDVLTSKGLQNLLNVKTEGEPQPGDILFFDSGIVMLYLGGDNAVGMLPEGAVTKGGVIKGKGIGFKYLGYGTIRYD